MAEKGESLRRYVRNEARSVLVAEVRDGKVPAISKRLRPAMADAILQGRFSELPPEVREAINSRLASGPQGWWTPGPAQSSTRSWRATGRDGTRGVRGLLGAPRARAPPQQRLGNIPGPPRSGGARIDLRGHGQRP